MENNTSNTNNFLNWVEIKNFKSIKDLRLDCKRVNIFIGKPNVGKSNILEGLGLFSMITNRKRMFERYIRYESLKQLFYDNNTGNAVTIGSDVRFAYLNLQQNSDADVPEFEYGVNRTESKYRLRENGEVETSGSTNEVSFIKKYDFSNLTRFKNSFSAFLLPPNGSNLYEVIRRNKELWAEFARLFTEQNLELVLDDEKQEIILQKKEVPFVWQYPFFSIADTFRRFMFYITAIESNKNSVVVFEEPEVHSFPPYTQDIAYRMIYSEENQFFVSTHSPYLLQTLVSNLNDDQLNVFVTYYEDYQTKVKALTAEELSFVQEYSTDVFFNLDRFIPNAQSANPA